jgi:hypothetical protein
MATQFDFAKSREYLQAFDFAGLFREILGWGNPTSRKTEVLELHGETYQRKMIAAVSGVAVYEVTSTDGKIPAEKVRKGIHGQTAELSLEHLLIFVDADRTQSYWYWMKRDGKKQIPRHLSYYRGQAGDLILGKLSALVFELEDFAAGDPAVVEVARKLQAALDVERVTKKFYGDFKLHLEWFVQQIQGIDQENDRRWYASVILNRLMFIYFLQFKGFVDGNPNYLRDKLDGFESGDFYRDFLTPLFFEGFAKAAPNRSTATQKLLGDIRYLNGGLFLEHRIEQEYEISIGNEAFDRTLTLFEKYSWNLDDAPGGNDDEIRPEVLGYIFEKYINQKEFGAYYTRPEITEYLCDRTINKLILDRVQTEKGQQFESIEELLFNLDGDLCLVLLEKILPNLSLLDPACGSGAFLVAAMKTLINVYSAIIGRIKFITNAKLTKWLKQIEAEHSSVQYYIKKCIITNNLYGVDIMEEATEITKLRLFLALVASAMKLEELEPLPNVDFNIMAGNSLIGLVRVDEDGFDAVTETKTAEKQRKKKEKLGIATTPQVNAPQYIQPTLFPSARVSSYRQLLREKNESIALFKKRAFDNPADVATEGDVRTELLKSSIEELNRKSQRKLNKLLLDEFVGLGIKYEEAQLVGKAKKRGLVQEDIDRLEPFHWGYHFNQIIAERGGFDAIIANPPWEVFKPNGKEFFAQHSDLVTKNRMDIKEFEKKQKELLQDPEIAIAWLDYQNQFPYVSAYFRSTEQYRNQISIVNGKKAGTDVNLYKLFLETCFNRLKPSGYCGIIIPTGFYTDLGAKQLREMIFSEAQLDNLLSLSNERFIFEGVDHRFKFCLVTFKKGGSTNDFSACFRIDPREAIHPNELEEFLNDRSIRVKISTDLVRQLSPDSLSVMEFRGDQDIVIAQKMSLPPLLGKQLTDTWNIKLATEFHMTNDSYLFKKESAQKSLPLYEGKMIHQFTHQWGKAKYWLDESEARHALLKKGTVDSGQLLSYQYYRLGFRDIARNSDARTMIMCMLPKSIFCNHKLPTIVISDPEKKSPLYEEQLFLAAIMNSFAADYIFRQRVTANLTFFIVNNLSVPRLTKADRPFQKIVERAAKLICTTPEFDDAEVGLGSHTNGITDEVQRAQLRAELDGIIAHLYHLTETEFAHILQTFPIVPEATKIMALNAYRDVERGLI